MGADSPVYKVEPEGKKGKARILHCDLLLPCNDLPIVDDQVNQKKMKPTTASGKRFIPLKHDKSDPDHCNRDGPEMTFRWCKGWFMDGYEMAL